MAHSTTQHSYLGDDGLTRSYAGLFNPNTMTIDTFRVFTIVPSSTLGGIVVLEPLFLDMQGSVCPGT